MMETGNCSRIAQPLNNLGSGRLNSESVEIEGHPVYRYGGDYNQMTETALNRMTEKWLLVVSEYEKVKQKKRHEGWDEDT